jgi:hypothetical protein
MFIIAAQNRLNPEKEQKSEFVFVREIFSEK